MHNKVKKEEEQDKIKKNSFKTKKLISYLNASYMDECETLWFNNIKDKCNKWYYYKSWSLQWHWRLDI